MYKLFLFLVFLLCSYSYKIVAQPITIDLHAGLSGYQGDLEASTLNFSHLNPAISLGGTYAVKPQIIARALATYTHVEAADRRDNGKILNLRNLHFRTRIIEVQLAGEYHFFHPDKKNWSPYITAGLAFFQFNPYTYTLQGDKVMLRPLGTEGQFLSPAATKPYSTTQVALPFGAGFLLPLSDHFRIGAEFSMRKLFTDYLDDVSGYYVDSAQLAQASGSLAAQMAYRGNELLGSDPYPSAGAQRGNPSNKDWYYTFTLRLSYSLKARNNKGRVGCPL